MGKYVEIVLKNSLKLKAASHNTAIWYTNQYRWVPRTLT